jgi:geranylgeranyl diphosphate synthase type I
MSITHTATAHAQARQQIAGAPSSAVMAGDLLARARFLVAPKLRRAVDALPEQTRPIAAYHFGWTDLVGRPETTGWGKGIRSALVLASARAVGGSDLSAVPAAAAIELVHNASLIQDDLLDADTVRRHRPAVWAAFGTPAAVLVGDALFHAAVRALHTGSQQRTVRASMVLLDAVQELIGGELADTSYEARQDVSLGECQSMSEAKTGALLGAACGLGARYGGANEDRIHALTRFGRHLGIAYQAIDDYLGLFGISTETGKPVLADLRRRKKSLPVLFALNADSPAAAELAQMYRRSTDLTPDQLHRAAELIEQTGARDWVLDYARQQITAANEYLASARPTADGLAELTAITRLITERDA